MKVSVKEALRQTIEKLSEQRCQQILKFAQHLEQDTPLSFQRLLSDPTFGIPSKGFGIFQPVEPVQGEGIAASELLVEDRG